MSIDITLDEEIFRPAFMCSGRLILRLPDDQIFFAKEFYIKLLGITKTRIKKGNCGVEETCESSTVFMEVRDDFQRHLELSNEWENGRRTSFQLYFHDNPDARNRERRIMVPNAGGPWNWAVKSTGYLPSSGEIGFGNEVVYKLEVCFAERDTGR